MNKISISGNDNVSTTGKRLYKFDTFIKSFRFSLLKGLEYYHHPPTLLPLFGVGSICHPLAFSVFLHMSSFRQSVHLFLCLPPPTFHLKISNIIFKINRINIEILIIIEIVKMFLIMLFIFIFVYFKNVFFLIYWKQKVNHNNIINARLCWNGWTISMKHCEETPWINT